MAGEQILDHPSHLGAAPAPDPGEALGVELDRDAGAEQTAAHRARPELLLDQPLDRMNSGGAARR